MRALTRRARVSLTRTRRRVNSVLANGQGAFGVLAIVAGVVLLAGYGWALLTLGGVLVVAEYLRSR